VAAAQTSRIAAVSLILPKLPFLPLLICLSSIRGLRTHGVERNRGIQMKPTLIEVPVMPEKIFIIDPVGSFLPCAYCRRYGSWYVSSYENGTCPPTESEAGGHTMVDSASDLSAASTTVAFRPRVTWKQLLLFEESDSDLTLTSGLRCEGPQ
jgi:hypothetical protein